MNPLLPSDEERGLLRESVRGFLALHWPAEHAVARQVDGEAVARIWRGLAGQGLATLGTNPEEGGLREILIVADELGRAACPAPFIGAMLANHALWPQRDGAAESILAALHAGSARLAFGFGTSDGDVDAGSVTLHDGRVDGVLRMVEQAAAATHVAVITGDLLALVERNADGVTTTPARALGLEGQDEVRLAQAGALMLALPAGCTGELAMLRRLMLRARAWRGAACVRDGGRPCEGARAVRQADRQLPGRAAQAGGLSDPA